MPSIKELIQETGGGLQPGSTFTLSETGADWLNRDHNCDPGTEYSPGEELIYEQQVYMDSLDQERVTLTDPQKDGLVRVPFVVDLFSSIEPPEWWQG